MEKNIEASKKIIYSFFKIFFIVFSFLLILSFFIDSIDYFKIFLRSTIFSIIYISWIFFEERLKEFLPIKNFLFLVFIILFTYFFSSYENFKKLDFVLGIDGFSEKVSKGEIKIKNLLSNPLVYQRYETTEEIFYEKLKEFNQSVEFLELKIHEYVNKIRAEHNLSILKFNEKLREIARYHSKDMAERNYFDHISIDGENLADRFEKFSYECKILAGNYVYEGAENLFLGYIYKSYSYDKFSGKIISYEFYSLEEFAKEVTNGWYNSEGHRKNILFEHWRDEGIGVFITSDGKIYITQVFC
ncbi:MAG: CAP domain-containing protein [Candidatus Aenigmatarchaeota archaeon]